MVRPGFPMRYKSLHSPAAREANAGQHWPFARCLCRDTAMTMSRSDLIGGKVLFSCSWLLCSLAPPHPRRPAVPPLLAPASVSPGWLAGDRAKHACQVLLMAEAAAQRRFLRGQSISRREGVSRARHAGRRHIGMASFPSTPGMERLRCLAPIPQAAARSAMRNILLQVLFDEFARSGIVSHSTVSRRFDTSAPFP